MNSFWMDKEILIVGSDGVIGQRIFEQLTKNGAKVVGTTKNAERVNPGKKIYLDLSMTIDKSQFRSFDFAIFCAGITKINECDRDPIGTKYINVISTLSILKTLNDLGIKTIFLSTNQVFNSNTRFPFVDDPIEPRNQYALQKADVESVILNELRNVSVLRLTKFFDYNSGIITKWIKENESGQSIVAFKDVNVSFIFIDELMEALEQAIDIRSTRLYHLGGLTEETYYDFCVRFFSKTGVAPNKIVGIYKNFGKIEYNSLKSNILR
jgi:dTDP-4-dehydrorhamnose reductase